MRVAPPSQSESRPAPQDATAVSSSNGNGAIGRDMPTKKKKKSKKRPSPFRVRAGCVVAIRYQPGDGTENNSGNNIKRISESGADNGTATTSTSETVVEVWADPRPGRDDGLALIGRRIRCTFPKAASSRSASPIPQDNGALEGEVVAILDRHPGITTVSLLIDQDVAERDYAFLPLDSIASGKTTAPDASSSDMSPAEQTRMELERQIRGDGKVAVQVKLIDAGIADVGSGGGRGSQYNAARWAIRKRVPVPAGLAVVVADGSNAKVHQIHVGDGNDSVVQQEQNWRWLASLSSPSSSACSALSLSSASDPHADSLLLGEVIKVVPSTDVIADRTLATITLRRIWLPEHTAAGRIAHHGPMEIFDDYIQDTGGEKDAVLYEVPIERLVVVGRYADRVTANDRSAHVGSDILQHFEVWQMYSAADGRFKRIGENAERGDADISAEIICSICSRPCVDDPVKCKKCSRTSHSECAAWERALLRHTFEEGLRPSDILHAEDCDIAATKVKCHSCRYKKKKKRAEKMQGKDDGASASTFFENFRKLLGSNNPLDFDIPDSFGAAGRDEIAFKPITKVRKREMQRQEPQVILVPDGAETDSPATTPRTPRGKKRAASPAVKRKRASPLPSPKGKSSTMAASQGRRKMQEEAKVFKPTCSRTLQYDPAQKNLDALHYFDPLEDLNSRVDISRRRIDADDADASTAVVEKKEGNSRAARASQRRMLKSYDGFGVDTLSGKNKEQSIRFGRSSIHAWGVFADEKISKGDMIVEYRGVLISNRVCEKREKEYVKTKVGSDYMFRIDNEVVCDATYQGNVARFINASCDPNCFTKIVTIDGTKRIIISAKKDIKPGEELVYDYMFPLEYDEKKRIPCHCGTSKCKGFMNWDNRYVVLGNGEQNKEASFEEKTA